MGRNDGSPDGLVVLGLESPGNFSTLLGRPGECISAALGHHFFCLSFMAISDPVCEKWVAFFFFFLFFRNGLPISITILVLLLLAVEDWWGK